MNINQQVTYLMRGVEYGDPSMYDSMKKELRDRLIEADRTGKPLRVYCGYDPRTSDLHIGHTVTMRKLRQFQELGHKVIFVIGTYTALIGDPSDKDKLRLENYPYWGIISTVIPENQQPITWFMGGTSSDWQGQPLTAVIVLEENAPILAEDIGHALIEGAIRFTGQISQNQEP